MKKKMYFQWLRVLTVISIWLFPGTVLAAEKVIKLGLLLPLTGQAAPVAEYVRHGERTGRS